MKKFLKIFIPLVLFVVLAVAVYQYRSTLSVQFAPALENIQNNIGLIFPQTPCSEPIRYTLGTFDTKFGISKEYFLSALTDAQNIWEKALGKKLFVYMPNDTDTNALKINLIYDYRQQATSNLSNLGITVKDNRASYDAIKVKYTALGAQLTSLKSDYNAKVQSFNSEQDSYEKQVAFSNAKGGASQSEYNILQAEKAKLKAESVQLQTEQKQINSMVDNINSMVVVLNRLAGTLNISVDKYNTVDATLSESFEEGVYTSDGSNRQIDIYEFSNRTKLVRVLTHELGHALGLDHVDDPKAIMYKLNQGNSLTLTQADINELKIKCEVK